MNWKMEALDKLACYDAMRHALQSIPQEIKQLEQTACSVSGASADKAPVKGGGSRQEELMLNNLVKRHELEKLLEQAKMWVRTTEYAMSVLTPEERLILTRLHIFPEREAHVRLCGDLGIEKSSLYRKRDKALRKFTLALYGTMES